MISATRRRTRALVAAAALTVTLVGTAVPASAAPPERGNGSATVTERGPSKANVTAPITIQGFTWL